MVLPSFSALFQGRPSLFFAVFDSFLVPLIRPTLRFLQALPQGFEQTTHMSRMIADPKFSSDHLCYPLARPYLPPETVSLGSSLQKLG
jgi:hypothetical protein